MNHYSYRFQAPCPANGKIITYNLEIESSVLVLVEQITATCAEMSGYHEQIADELHKALGGIQTIVAHHHGVTITTRRGSC